MKKNKSNRKRSGNLKSSLKISLVLIGAMNFAGCGGQETGQRPMYKSRQDCIADWSEKDCEEIPHGSSYYNYHSAHYYGPYIGGRGAYQGTDTNSYNTTTRNSFHSIGMASVSRGGLGSSSRFHFGRGG